jgi:hypothetical protein
MSPTPSFAAGPDLWRSWAQLVPSTLVQPVLPGWTFNINSHNSTAPDMEAQVVAEHSYGRQLGRISDALREVLRRLPGEPDPNGAFAEFTSMWNEIEAVKNQGAAQRLKQIGADLARLKANDEPEYRRVRGALELALKMAK